MLKQTHNNYKVLFIKICITYSNGLKSYTSVETSLLLVRTFDIMNDNDDSMNFR